MTISEIFMGLYFISFSSRCLLFVSLCVRIGPRTIHNVQKISDHLLRLFISIFIIFMFIAVVRGALLRLKHKVGWP